MTWHAYGTRSIRTGPPTVFRSWWARRESNPRHLPCKPWSAVQLRMPADQIAKLTVFANDSDRRRSKAAAR